MLQIYSNLFYGFMIVFSYQCPADGHLSCFQSFVFTISALINSHRHMSFHTFVFFFHMLAGQEKRNIMVHNLTA